MKITYIHERSGWPDGLHWRDQALSQPLAELRHKQGRLHGHMEALGFPLRQEAGFETLTADVLKTSEIEGEKLDAAQVRSSLARRLGMDIAGMKPADRNVDGIVDVMLDATREYDLPLTKERLFGWHTLLFPSGRSGFFTVKTGAWRDDKQGPMEVVSGAIGRERVHYVAPAARRLSGEMRAFLRWFDAPAQSDPVLKAALAHFWFVTLHPFDDGNGRLARAIADMALARSEGSPWRYYSMSTQIRAERSQYYEMLERSQKGPLDITPWMEWFLACLGRSIDNAQTSLKTVLFKARFWETHAALPFNPRQRLMLNKLFDGFEGKLTSTKWAALARCSQDTAMRDIQFLIAHGILAKDDAGGRSTSYGLLT